MRLSLEERFAFLMLLLAWLVRLVPPGTRTAPIEGRVLGEDGPLAGARVRFAESQPRPPEVRGTLSWEGAGQEWTAVCHGTSGELQAAASACGARIVEEHRVGLDEIFVARMRPTPTVIESE